MRFQFRFFILFWVFIALFFLARSFSAVMSTVNDFVCVFAYATSYDVKVSFFLSYVAFCFLILAFFSRRHFLFNERKLKIFTFSLIAFLVSCNFFSYFAFLVHQEIPFELQGKYWFWLNGIGDTTSLHHIHTFKPVWYYAIAAFGLQSLFGRLDASTLFNSSSFVGAGYPSTQILPAWFFESSFFVYLALFVLIVALLVRKSQEWTEEKIIFIPLYLISSFSILTCLIDGGALTHYFLFSFNFFVFLLIYRRERSLQSYRPLALFAVFSVLLLWSFHTYENIFLFYFPFYIALLILYLGPLFLLLVFRLRPKTIFVIICGLYLVVFQGLVLMQGYVFNRDPLYHRLPLYKGDVLWITTYMQQLPLKIVYSKGPLVVYEETIQNDTNIASYVKTRNLDSKWVFNQVKINRSFDQDSCLDLKTQFGCFGGFVKAKEGAMPKTMNYQTGFCEVRLTERADKKELYDFIFCIDQRVSPLNFYVLYSALKDIFGTEKFTICSLQLK